MARRRYAPTTPTFSNVIFTDHPSRRLWLLRILQLLGGHKEFVEKNGLSSPLIGQYLGLTAEDADDDNEPDFDPKAMRAQLQQLHRQAERAGAHHADLPAELRANTQRLAQLVGLNATDCRILEFTCCLHTDPLLEEATGWLGDLSSSGVCHTLAQLLDLPLAAVRMALAPQGLLAQSGLVVLDRDGRSWLKSCLDMLSKNFADLMQCEHTEAHTLLRGKLNPGGRASLALADFAHVQKQLDIALPYLRQACASGQRGVNLFIHGAPGTGKSELARTLAQQLDAALFEVASEDDDGDPVSGTQRLRTFRAAQHFLAHQRALLVFDEAEDVFNDGGLFNNSTAQERKAWMNRMLEDNPVPMLWLSNSAALDAAFMRRFDMVFELPIPPRAQRARILAQQCDGLLDAPAIARLAEVEPLAPAVVARAAAVVRAIGSSLPTGGAAQALELLVSNTLQAQGHPALARPGSELDAGDYDPAFLHTDADLAQIATGIAASASARLCLYGPPGTGKTAYGRWLAQQLDKPLLVRRASDLLSKYVGEAEKNIAQAFTQAAQDGAVLLIDEVDSFLQERQGAQRSWELSQVNEMLTQIERFDGVFIASTNLLHGLDQAALRRFDLKVQFGYLRAPQAWALLQRHCAALGLAAPAAELQAALARLAQLTPGDFAAVRRQQRFRPLPDAAAIVAALQAECALKAGAKAAMGFV